MDEHMSETLAWLMTVTVGAWMVAMCIVLLIAIMQWRNTKDE